MALQNGYSINTALSDESGDTEPLLEDEAVEGVESVHPQCCSTRLNLAVMMFFGFSVVYGLRVNLSVAMVAMVNETRSQPTLNGTARHECPVPSHSFSNSSPSPDQPDGIPQYSWDSGTQGWLLGAFFFGYLFTQIPGGYLAGHYGGSKFLGGGVLGTAALTLLTPQAAQMGASWLFALRALEGFGEGVTFPAMMAMWACWAPPLERSRLITLSGAGANFGAFVALPLTGFICHSLGWPAVFYICGGAGCLWAVAWFILVSDNPHTHPRISKQEQDYIINTIGPQGGAHGWSVPLLSLLLSGPLWAIILSQMCANWSYYTLLTSLPTYMDTVLHFDLRQNSFLSALPYLGAWLFSLLSGVVADSLLEKELLSTTAVRKIFTITGKETFIVKGSAVTSRVPGGIGLLRVQWNTSCDLSHPLYHYWGNKCCRGFHQPDRHRPTVRRSAPGNHQHFRDHPRGCGTYCSGLPYQRSHCGGLEECVLRSRRHQCHRGAHLHLVWKWKDPEVGSARGREGHR
ncbi:sialin isoform X2 [Hypomesus transpacificus]|uniref:sialin isoform X2 n=1 Tax=Hypomesus transpacificus TaxID=137520 RepID=UPI001F0833D2|nr:sialin isoform X2 [Hypomesus transpacificus]